jgi:hypothetical protein
LVLCFLSQKWASAQKIINAGVAVLLLLVVMLVGCVVLCCVAMEALACQNCEKSKFV